MESASPYFVLIPFPTWNRPNLTVLTHALVTRITFEGKRATGVECIYNGKTHRISAGLEVVIPIRKAPACSIFITALERTFWFSDERNSDLLGPRSASTTSHEPLRLGRMA
jgi:hypothetical protein